MNQNQVKIVQSRLKNRGKKFTLEQIRTYILANYHDEELTDDQMSAIVDHLTGGEALALSNASELSQAQKQTLIQQVASTLNIDLPIEQIREISQQMNWALSDRASLKERVQSAIIAWVNYQIEQDKQQTDEMMREVESHLATKLQESNEHFTHSAQRFSRRVSEAVGKFRTTETELLDLFKVPS